MKKKTLLLPVFAVLAYLSFSSNSSGPSVGTGGDATGSPASSHASCGVAGCHTASSATTIDSIVVFDLTTNTNVSSYIPGRTYNVTIHGSNATKSKYGFQVEILNASHITTGTLTATQTSTAVRNSGSGTNKVIEHTSPLPLTGGHIMATFQWKAPAAGSAVATIYTAINAVNGDGTDGGDAASAPLTKVLAENTNVNDINNTISLKAYPNPVHYQLKVSMDNAEAGTYSFGCFDMTGKVIYKQDIKVTSATQDILINTKDWNTGVYQLMIQKDGAKHVMPIVKQ